MTTILRPHLGHTNDASALLRDPYRSEADLRPNPNQHPSYVGFHHMANPQADRAIEALLKASPASNPTSLEAALSGLGPEQGGSRDVSGFSTIDFSRNTSTAFVQWIRQYAVRPLLPHGQVGKEPGGPLV